MYMRLSIRGFYGFQSHKIECVTHPCQKRKKLTCTHKTKHNSHTHIHFSKVERNIEAKERQVIDARPKPRFLGDAPEPRPIESGHIAGSACVPWADVIDSSNKYKKPEDLKKVKNMCNECVCVCTCMYVCMCCIHLDMIDVSRKYQNHDEDLKKMMPVCKKPSTRAHIHVIFLNICVNIHFYKLLKHTHFYMACGYAHIA